MFLSSRNEAVSCFCALQFKIPWKQTFELIPCHGVCVFFERGGISRVLCGSVQGARENGLPKGHKRQHQRYGASSLTGMNTTRLVLSYRVPTSPLHLQDVPKLHFFLL